MNIFDGSILESRRHPCRLMERTRAPDGLGGGRTAWTEGEALDVIFSEDTTTQALIAEQQGFKSTYHAMVSREAEVHFHDVMKRLEDGKVFRVVKGGEDDQTPGASALDMKHLVLELWEVPDDD